ncbi:MAG: polyprenyl synthetase family protein [Acidimicrobiales bacterium]
MTAPAALVSVADRVSQRLADVLDEEQARWGSLDPALEAPIASLKRLVLGGGKRLRPAFCHWSFVGAGGDPDDPMVLDAGAAFEFLQAFALIHDDVMDGSDTRRGVPAVHAEFSERHRLNGWRGEARRFGEGVAILAGDVAHVYADRLMTPAPTEAMLVWHELRIELNVGQYLDIEGTARAATDLETARRISRYKSGKYTIERPLHIGAALCGRLDDLEPVLTDYGAPLGEAFQLRDDLLGVYGEEALTGKPVGGDLREGKPTPLLAHATDRADEAQRQVLAQVGSPDLGADDIAAIQTVIDDTGARAQSESTIATLTDQAAHALTGAPLVPEAIDALCALASYVGTRRH